MLHGWPDAGKDKVVKYWDADKFEHLLTLEGHHSEVWCMALSAHGDFLVTGSHDRSLRRWERTDEPFFVEEEREKRLESLFEADIEVCSLHDANPKLLISWCLRFICILMGTLRQACEPWLQTLRAFLDMARGCVGHDSACHNQQISTDDSHDRCILTCRRCVLS